MKKYKILVTGACAVTARSVVRSLNISQYFKDQCLFIGTDLCNSMYGVYEGLYDKVYKVPAFNDPDYRSAIQKIIDRHGIEFAIILPEQESIYWSDYPFDVKFLRIPSQFGHAVLSKLNLYKMLDETGLTPAYQLVDREEILEDENAVQLSYPMWIRDYSEGTASGMGSFSPENYDELKAWLNINHSVNTFMLSEFLPGRNLACFLMFSEGQLLKYGVAERIDYIMAKVAVSGITGNTSKGKLLNAENVFEVAKKAVDYIINKTGEVMNGVVVVDLKEDANGRPMVTEINLRHVAFTSTFASAGLNFSEYQMLLLSDQKHLIPEGLTIHFPEDNIMLRDVDGLPLYLEKFDESICNIC